MRYKLFIFLAVLLFLTAACSSDEVVRTNTNNNAAQPANTAVIENNSTEITVKNTNSGEKVMIPGINEPIDNTAANSNTKPEKIKAPEGRPAPDDSVFTTQLTDVGLETRTFKNHPLLNKVERITSPKGKTIKVYLRSGKIVELPGDKLANISSIPASEILKAVGIAPKEMPGLPSKSLNSGQKVQ